MKIIYFFLKLLKTQNKITFMSRQTNTRNIDFDMIIDEIKEQDSTIKIVVLNKRLEKNLKSKITYFLYMFKQMYHMATSKIIIIDSYAILVSILKHKKNTKVIQIWHALGSLKKFGYSILDKKEGRNSKIAKVMRMHGNYDYIITSSNISKNYLKEAYNAKEEQMVVLGLPRIDFLQSKKEEEKIKKKFYSIYKNINNNKENILYIPTNRIEKEIDIKKVAKNINYSKYNLIIKLHNGREIIYTNNRKYEEKGNFFLGLELLHVVDYIITDYSAICHEAALVNKPIYFYVYDYEEYVKNRGFYIDYNNEMPGIISKDIKEIKKSIENKIWYPDKIEKFLDKYVEKRNVNVTKEFVKFIFELM